MSELKKLQDALTVEEQIQNLLDKNLVINNIDNKFNESSDCFNQYKSELHYLLDKGLYAVKNGNSRPAADVFSDIEKNFDFDRI